MTSEAGLPLVTTVLQIFVADLLLSGDNALVVGLVSQALPDRQRRRAIGLGIALAIVLRAVVGIFATFLLQLPGFMLIGGVALVVIAVNVATGAYAPRFARRGAAGRQPGLGAAVAMIVTADLTMSIDNMVAIAAIARGDLLLLFLGLALSIPLLMWGSALVVALMRRFRPLVVLGGMVLGWIGGDIAVADPLVAGWIHARAPALLVAIPVFAALFVLLEARLRRKRKVTHERTVGR